MEKTQEFEKQTKTDTRTMSGQVKYEGVKGRSGEQTGAQSGWVEAQILAGWLMNYIVIPDQRDTKAQAGAKHHPPQK